MASGLSRSIVGGSDSFGVSYNAGSEEIFDFNCSPCEDKGLMVEAAFYCAMCDDFCCVPCTQVHNSLKATKSHPVLGRDEIGKWGQQVKYSMLPTSVCSDHPNETLKLLCINDNMLCCSVCASLHHRACTDVVYVPKKAKDIKQSYNLLMVGQNIDQLMQYADEMIKCSKKNQTTLDKSKEDYLDNINDIQQQVNDFFNNLKKNASDEMDKFHDSKVKDLQTLMKSLDDYKSKLAQLQMATQPSSTNNESQLFIEMFTAHQQLPAFQNELKNLATPQTKSFYLHKNQKLQEIFTTIKNLGELKEEKTTIQRKLPIIKPLQLQIYKTSNVREINVKMSSDKTNCYIYGSCQMPNGDILLADSSNKKVKRLNRNYKPTDYLVLPASPLAICCMGDTEAVVICDNNTVYFLSITRRKMPVTRSLKLDHRCYGIAYHNGRLFVSDLGKNVYIYTTSVKHLKTVHTDNNGANIFSGAQHICVSPDGSKIYVTDDEKGLVTLDSEGNHLSTYDSKDLYEACGVCVDIQERVLVCGYRSHNILQLDEGGTTRVGEVVGRGDNIDNPLSICIDNHNSTLIVCMKNPNNIKVFDLKFI